MPASADPAQILARNRLVFGSFTLDPLRAELLREGQVVPLRRKAFDLLHTLASRPGEVHDKQALMAAVWPGVIVGDDSLAQCVHEVRGALGEDGSSLVRTVQRRGYRFDADVHVEPLSEARAGSAGSAVPHAVGPAEPPARPEPPQASRAPQAARVRIRLSGLLLAGALAATLAAAAWYLLSGRLDARRDAPSRSIVMLPLGNEDGTPASQWFAEALTADLTAELGQLPGAFVIARDTAAAYRGTSMDPRALARALGVRYVVSGSVRRSDENLRLVLAMSDGDTGAQHWAGSFDIQRARLAPSLLDISAQVARSLSLQMYRTSGERAAALDPEQVRADDLAMQGWSIYLRGFSRENFQAALHLFEQAVAKDPRSVQGWGGVAVINGMGASLGWLPERDAAVARLEFASARLQELQAEHLFALLAKSNLANLRRDYEAHVLVARMINERFPNHAPSHATLGLGLMNLGRFGECVEPVQRALRLSPRDPLLGIWHWQIANCHFMAQRYQEAAVHARIAEQANPRLPLPPLLLAASLALEGHSDEARTIVANYKERHPDYRAADVAKLMRSEHPGYAAGRSRMIESLRNLGMP